MKDEIIKVRYEKQQDTASLVEMTKQFLAREAIDASKLKEQRAAIVELNSQLRQAYNLSTAATIEGAHLKAVEQAEKELQQERHSMVLRILELAIEDINH